MHGLGVQQFNLSTNDFPIIFRRLVKNCGYPTVGYTQVRKGEKLKTIQARRGRKNRFTDGWLEGKVSSGKMNLPAWAKLFGQAS